MSIWQRLRHVLRKDRLEDEPREELDFHLDARAREYQQRGMAEREPRTAARKQLGNAKVLAEETRDYNIAIWADNLWRDIWQSGRAVRRNPGFTTVAVLSLALGIGATASLFSVVDTVLLKPLPLPNAERLLWVSETRHGGPRGGGPARLNDFQGVRAFEGVAGFYGEGITVRGPDGPERLAALRTFGPVGRTLGVQTLMGRMPSADEERGIGEPVALISYGLWQRKFGGAGEVLGKSLTIGPESCTIVGVLPATLLYPEKVDIWIPAPSFFQTLDRTSTFLGIVARLKPDATKAHAQAEMDALSARLGQEYPATDRDIQVQLTPLQEHEVQGARTPLLALFGAMAGVLLIACVNVAGLLLARGWARRRESAIRAALGAGEWRLLRLRLAESLWLALMGGALGVVLAYVGVDVLKRVLPADVPRLSELALDARVLLFAAAVSLCCALLAGLLPAWQDARSAVARQIRQGGGGSIGAGRQRLRSALVASEVALSMMLLVSAALLLRSVFEMTQVPLGFRTEQVAVFRTNFQWGTPSERQVSYARSVLERLSSMPGTQAAGVVDSLPLNGGTQGAPAAIRGKELAPELARIAVGWRVASPGYFKAIGVPVLSGSMFPEWNGPGKRKPVLVNQRFAQLYFPGEDPIGREVRSSPKAGPPDSNVEWFQIVGVIGNLRRDLREDLQPEVFMRWGDASWPLLSFAVKVQGDPAAILSSIRKTVAQVSQDQVVEDLRPLRVYVEQSVASSRVQASLLGTFATVALMLAAIGLYGLLAGEVARRTKEFGVRLALGAPPAQLMATTLRSGLTLTCVGLLIGALGSAAVGRLLRTLLFQVEPVDVVAWIGAAAVLVLVAMLACWVPARRASRVDPVIALRHD